MFVVHSFIHSSATQEFSKARTKAQTNTTRDVSNEAEQAITPPEGGTAVE